MNSNQKLNSGLLTGCVFGSRAHGTAVSRSDMDIRGVYAPSYEEAIGPFPINESISLEGDVLFYEARHFAAMTASCNPNILEVLWTPDEMMLHEHPAWKIFRAEKFAMLSRKVADTYTGYAHGEIKRLHKLLGFPEMNEEAEYKMRKGAAHVIRLLRMAREALNGQGLIVSRPDREELLAIKTGIISVEAALAEAASLKDEIADMALKSSLPKEVQEDVVKKAMVATLKNFWSMPPESLRGVMKNILNLPVTADDETRSPVMGRAVVIDIEGSGNAGMGVMDIVEIGCVETLNGKSTGNAFSVRVRPDRAPTRFVQKLHGIKWSDVQNSPRFEQVVNALLGFIGDSPLVAHAAISDRRMLFSDMRLAGIPVPENNWYCTARLMRSILFGKSGVRHNLPSLDTTCDLMSVNRELRHERLHGALLDAELAASAMEAMLKNEHADTNLWKISGEKTSVKMPSLHYTVQENHITVSDGTVSQIIPLPDFPSTHAMKFEKNKVVIRNSETGEISNPSGPCIIYRTIKDGKFIALTKTGSKMSRNVWSDDSHVVEISFQPK